MVKRINYKEFNKTKGGMREFANAVFDALGDNIFNQQAWEKLIFASLSQVRTYGKPLKENLASIERICFQINESFGIEDMKDFLKNPELTIESSALGNQAKLFCKYVLGITKLPFTEYFKLESKVKNDLINISKLIDWYETNESVKTYKTNTNYKPGIDAKYIDFYKRCLGQRDEILKYYLFDIKDRALKKSFYTPKWAESLFQFTETYYDRPYKFSFPFYLNHFDCRKIDPIGHRLGEFYIKDGNKLAKLYKSNKLQFYKQYFKKTKFDQHFNTIEYYSHHLPIHQDRKLVINELKALSKLKRWVAFYAVILPQIEGVFTEMKNIIQDENSSTDGLSRKVKTVRSKYLTEDSFFDYCQYELPTLRNRFSHLGREDEYMLNSYDLLVDLAYLYRLFSELDDPYLKVYKLIKKRNHENFYSIFEVTEYLELLQKINYKKKSEIKLDIETFEKEFLSVECGIDYMCYELLHSFPEEYSKFELQVFQLLNRNNIVNDNPTILNTKAIQIINSNESLKSDFNITFENNSNFKTLITYCSFITLQKKNLPTLNKEVKAELDAFCKIVADQIKNIQFCKEVIESV